LVGTVIMRRYASHFHAFSQYPISLLDYCDSDATTGPSPTFSPISLDAPPLAVSPAHQPSPLPPSAPPPYRASQRLPRSPRRVTAMDTDQHGRRLAPDGTLQENDHDGVLGDKDVLPAYDGAGGPPKYFELNVRAGAEGAAGYEGVRASGRAVGEESLGEDVAQVPSPEPGHTPSSPAYDPNGPTLTSVQEYEQHQSGMTNSGSSAPPIPVHADSAADLPPPPATTTTRRDASLPPPPN